MTSGVPVSESITRYLEERRAEVLHEEIGKYRASLAHTESEIERLKTGLGRILDKNPNGVGPYEAADMAVEFHMIAHLALSPPAHAEAPKGERE